MGKIINRRSRTPNWLYEEKQYLLELIRQRKDIVVPKSNNGPNYSEEKDIAWNEILHELTIKFLNKFSDSSVKKVKTQWQNMKRIAREEITLNGKYIDKLSRQSLEVCYILDMVKDGVIKLENENFNETIVTTDVEIKAESIDEEIIRTDCSNAMQAANEITENEPNPSNTVTIKHHCNFQVTSNQSDIIMKEFPVTRRAASTPEAEIIPILIPINSTVNKKDAFCMTDAVYMSDLNNLHLFHAQFQKFINYTSTERQIKMDTLKEERYIVKAMRETAELNKIIAEQKLKHVLWVKRQEMAMYSGEPGSGAGKGGGGGGSIREAGGAFGKMEAAREEEYFYKKQKEQLHNIKDHLNKEISFHQDSIKRHEDAIRRHKEQMATIEKK